VLVAQVGVGHQPLRFTKRGQRVAYCFTESLAGQLAPQEHGNHLGLVARAKNAHHLVMMKPTPRILPASTVQPSDYGPLGGPGSAA
jgi:hypothetical protein